MKTSGTIQVLFSVLLLIVGLHRPGYSQDQIPPEKKKALHRFDPADIFPEEREVVRSKGKKKQKVEQKEDTKLRSVEPPNPAPLAAPPAPKAPPAEATPSPTPTVAVQEVVATPSATPTPETKATPQMDSITAAQSKLPPSVGEGNQAGAGQGFPIYFLIPMLLLILFALIAIIISLKKQLRTP